MNDLKKNVNLPLLYEVRKDVFVKLRNAECGERCFSLMHHMDLLTRIARKEGLLALEGAVKEIPSEIGFYQDIQSAVFYICDGIQGEDVIEILSARYWIKNLRGGRCVAVFYDNFIHHKNSGLHTSSSAGKSAYVMSSRRRC